MEPIKVVATITQKLKWEPELVVSPFKVLPSAAWDECLSLIEDNENLLDEIESVIETAQDDHVLTLALSYTDNKLNGFCLFNAWAGQTKSKAILLCAVKGLTGDFASCDGISRLTGALLVERMMQEALNLKNHDTVKDLEEIYCIGKDSWAQDIIVRFGFKPIPAY